MLYFLILLTTLLFGIIMYLNYKFNRDKVTFQSKIKVLEEFIIQVKNEQTNQNIKLQLSDELRQKLKTINEVLNKDIFDLNYELFDQLSKKK